MRDLAFAIIALLAFLIPIGFYCFLLATFNRRSKPLVVTGAWDTVGLLFAASGFFLATVPMLISEFYHRTYAADEGDNIIGIWMSHWALWVVYYLLVVAGSALMILWRSHKTVIYNVDPDIFPKAMERSLANLGLTSTMRREHMSLAPAPPAESSDSTAFTQAAPRHVIPHDPRHAELVVDVFAAMCHVTLHWESYAPDVRGQVEAELERNLEGVAPLENGASAWFLNVSGMIFGALVMVVLAFAILVAITHR